MKITTQLLRNKIGGPLHGCQFLDLSCLDIEVIEKLSACPKLSTLLLRGNSIEFIDNLECCPQLWKLDLANNQVKILTGLQRFVALGTLVLSNNDIGWAELAKIRHLHILDLYLHGNPKLEKDPYYRIHVIDCLPNVWMLDGRIITSAERVQVQQFYEDSALTDKPVRRKLGAKKFTPSILQKVQVDGVFGERTDHLMRRFPVNGSINIDLDRRRLHYLAYNLQEDLFVEAKAQKRSFSIAVKHRKFLEELLNVRELDRVKCNMILLLLVASLEFAMPISLMEETLNSTQLANLGKVSSMMMFLLSRDARCQIVSLLLSAVKVDKDVGEEGGLYDKLYLCLYYSVSELTRLSQGKKNDPGGPRVDFYKQSKFLIASEIVQLFCIVPAFFDFVNKDPGVKNLVSVATNDHLMVDKISKYVKRLEHAGVEKQSMFEQIAELILTAIQKNTLNIINKSGNKGKTKKIKEDFVLQTSKAIPYRPKSCSMFSSEYQAKGIPTPARTTARLKSGKQERERYFPKSKLGDKVLLGPQNLGRVISIPEPNLILVQMDVIPAETGAMVSNSKNIEEHYTYIDMKDLYWDDKSEFWRPQGTSGDRITIQRDELEAEDAADFEALMTPPSAPYGKYGTTQQPSNLLNGLDHKSLKNETPSRTKTTSTSSQVKEGEIPRPVSQMLKEKLNLRLEVDRSASRLSQSTLDGTKASRKMSAESVKFREPLSETEDNQSRKKRRKVNFAQQSSKTLSGKTRVLEIEALPLGPDVSPDPRPDPQGLDSEEPGAQGPDPGLYSSVRDAIEQVQSVVQSTPRAFEKRLARKTRSGRPADFSPKCSDDEDDEVLFQNADPVLGATTESRRSSLASDDEPELKELVEMSRPSTSHKTAQSDRATHGTKSPETIAIPQMTMEGSEEKPSVISMQAPNATGELSIVKETDEHSSSRSGFARERRPLDSRASSRAVTPKLSARSPIPSQSLAFPEQIIGNNRSRPPSVTNDASYRMIISPYQVQRTEAWKSSVQKQSTAAGQAPPPQRPSSPYNMQRVGSAARSSPFPVTKTEKWLGGGRDLHWEKMQKRPKSGHMPGWMEGLPQRPKSAAALRAMKRAKTPTIATPSSMNYESSIAGRGTPDVSQAMGYRPYSASAAQQRPRPKSGDLIHMHGAILQSHPRAKEAYAIKQLSKVMCPRCQNRKIRETESLRELLGQGCEDVLGTLTGLEPCEHVRSVQVPSPDDMFGS